MSARPSRTRLALARMGEAFEVDSNLRIGLFQAMAPDRAMTFMTEAEFEASIRPVWEISVPADDETAVSDEIEWNGRMLSVLKLIDVRIGDEVVLRTLIAVES